jgi:hypothetical protein
MSGQQPSRRKEMPLRTDPVRRHHAKNVDDQLDCKLRESASSINKQPANERTPFPLLDALLSSECHTAASVST